MVQWYLNEMVTQNMFSKHEEKYVFFGRKIQFSTALLSVYSNDLNRQKKNASYVRTHFSI